MPLPLGWLIWILRQDIVAEVVPFWDRDCFPGWSCLFLFSSTLLSIAARLLGSEDGTMRAKSGMKSFWPLLCQLLNSHLLKVIGKVHPRLRW